MSPRSVQAILFDKDGTLFDFQHSWGEWAAAVLHDLADGQMQLMQPLADAISFDLKSARFAPESVAIAGTLEQTAAALMSALPNAKLPDLVAHLEGQAVQAVMAPVVPLPPFLGQLRDLGLKLGVATNATEGEAQAHLQHAGIIDDFDLVLGCDSGFGAKPAPDICAAFARATGCAPSQVVMVGDSLHDLVAGRAAGMQTVGVLTGVAQAQELAPFADAVLPDIGHLPAWLARQT